MRGEEESGPLALFVRRSQRLESVANRHIWISVILLGLMAVAKAGPRPLFGWGPFDHGVPIIPGDNRPWKTVLPQWLVDRESTTGDHLGFILLAFLILIACLAVLATIVLRRFARSEVLLVWALIILGPVGLVMISGAGSLDGIFLVSAAALTLGTTHRWWIVLAGAALMVYSNPGQSVLAGLALFVLTFSPAFRQLRQRAIMVLLGGLALAIIEALLASGASQGRSLPDLAALSLNFSLFTLPLRILTIYGVLWGLVLALILATPKRNIASVTLGLGVIPIAATFLTLDGTRVGVGVSSLAAFAMLTVVVPKLSELLQVSGLTALVPIAVVAVAPMPLVWMNTVEVPWTFIVDVISSGRFT